MALLFIVSATGPKKFRSLEEARKAAEYIVPVAQTEDDEEASRNQPLIEAVDKTFEGKPVTSAVKYRVGEWRDALRMVLDGRTIELRGQKFIRVLSPGKLLLDQDDELDWPVLVRVSSDVTDALLDDIEKNRYRYGAFREALVVGEVGEIEKIALKNGRTVEVLSMTGGIVCLNAWHMTDTGGYRCFPD